MLTTADGKEIRQEMKSPDTTEAVKILETLDAISLERAKAYMSALADVQQLEKAKAARTAVV